MSLFALAFADSAFKEGGIQRPEDLYTLETPHFKEMLGIQWKPELLETSIFRHQVKGDISDSMIHIRYILVLSVHPQKRPSIDRVRSSLPGGRDSSSMCTKHTLNG